MTWLIILEVIILGIALSVDAFVASITSGITYSDLNKKRTFFIAGLFGLMQAIMPLIGYWLVEGIEIIVKESAKQAQASLIMKKVVSWTAFGLLVIIGVKMIIDAIIDLGKPVEERKTKKFSYKEIIYLSVATSIDALGSGVALHSGLSTNLTVWLHVSIILCITFLLSFIGVVLGHQIEKLFKGKYQIAEIISGVILIGLAVWIIISHYLGI